MLGKKIGGKKGFALVILALLTVGLFLASASDSPAAAPANVKGFALTAVDGGKSANVGAIAGGRPAFLVFVTPT